VHYISCEGRQDQDLDATAEEDWAQETPGRRKLRRVMREILERFGTDGKNA
jgi:hypothetical protein